MYTGSLKTYMHKAKKHKPVTLGHLRILEFVELISWTQAAYTLRVKAISVPYKSVCFA